MDRLKTGLVSCIGVLVLFGALFGVVLNVPVAGVGGTIYIRADGSVEPLATPISNLNNVIYTFTDNINDPLVIERDNIVVDGDGHATRGIGTGTGIGLSYRSNVTLKNLVITQFGFGISLNHSASCAIVGNIMMENSFEAIRLYESLSNNITSNDINATDYDGIVLYGSSDNNIDKNNLTDNYDGIRLYESSKNDMAENIVTNNYYGIFLAFSSDNSIFHNNVTANDGNGVSLAWSSSGNRIVENHIAANKWCGIYLNASSNNVVCHNSFVDNAQQISVNDSVNLWDDGYPSGGNYWSDYNGTDLYGGSYQNETGSDGIGDTSYAIDANNQDRYPLLDTSPPTTIHDYDGTWHTVDFTIKLTFNDDRSGIAETYYKINDGPIQNVSAHGQPLITAEGADNKLEYWSVDNAGNEELPHKILTGIKLDKTTPIIGTPSQSPSGTVDQWQEVKVSMSITDAFSGVKNATLLYTINNGSSWETPRTMNYNVTTNSYEATILGQPDGTILKYKIVAYDIAGNDRVENNAGEYYAYLVIPEFPSFLIVPLLMIATLVVAIVRRRKQSARH